MTDSYIALVDCDSFFVSCEQALNPDLAEKAVCVLSNNDACVVARSKEAKKMGVKMGMPYFMARKDFPNCIYLSGDIPKYKQFSKKVMNILKNFSPNVEVYSIDEAFVELSGLKRLYAQNYLGIVKQIRLKIKDELGINVSIGVSRSKVLAKLACEKAKDSGGIYLIGRKKIPKELKNTPIQDIWGIGRQTTIFFKRWGVLNCADLVEKTDEWLKLKIGKRGVELKHELLGKSVDKVKPRRRFPKSIQNTRSFAKSTEDLNYIKNALNVHIHTSCTKLRYLGGKCSTVAVMLRSKDFHTVFIKEKLANPSDFELEISRLAIKMLEKNYQSGVVYRSCGVTLEDLNFENQSQLNLFDSKCAKNFDKLSKSIDILEKKFGKNVVKTGFWDPDAV